MQIPSDQLHPILPTGIDGIQELQIIFELRGSLAELSLAELSLAELTSLASQGSA